MRRGAYGDDIVGVWEQSKLICCLRRCAAVVFGPNSIGLRRNLDISFSDLTAALQTRNIVVTWSNVNQQNKHVTIIIYSSSSARISVPLAFLGFESSPLKSSLNNNRSTCLRLLSLSPSILLENVCVV